jgi:plastocyanin
MKLKNFMAVPVVVSIIIGGIFLGKYAFNKTNAPSYSPNPIFQSSPASTTQTLKTSSPSAQLPREKDVILMFDDSFEPKEISVKIGNTLTFENRSKVYRWPASDIHPTHGIYPEFDPQKAVAPGEKWTFTFDKIGKWKFHDHIDPTIKGIITVAGK